MECIDVWQCMLGPVDVVGGDESSFPGLRGEQEIIATFLPDTLPSTCVLFDTSQYHCGWPLLEVGEICITPFKQPAHVNQARKFMKIE